MHKAFVMICRQKENTKVIMQLGSFEKMYDETIFINKIRNGNLIGNHKHHQAKMTSLETTRSNES